MSFITSKKYKLHFHFLFWVVIWLFYVFFFSYNSNHLNFVLTLSTYLIPVTAIATYGMIYKLIPKYLLEKKHLQFGLYLIFSLLITTFLVVLFLTLTVSFIPNFKALDLPPMGRNYVFIVLLVYLVVAAVSYINLLKRNSQVSLANVQLQKAIETTKFKAKEQELVFLKNQIHPHFLFNTLNTIYGLTLKKSDNTSDIILKLSSLLDYILYQINKKEVLLIDELKHIEDYLDLERIRFKDTLKVEFKKNITSPETNIAPMLLLPFVENAFKHGSIINGVLKVKIDVTVTDTILGFNIKNSYIQKPTKRGLGLKNIKERLELLYPNNYNLQVDTASEMHEVNLKINIKTLQAYE